MRSAVIVATLALACAPASTLGHADGSRHTEILWDSFGVPHIFAQDREGLAYAFGWAQMRNHGDLLLTLYQQGRGRAGEMLGEDYLEDDRWVWTLGLRALAERDYAAQSPAMRAHLDAFARGINDFARANPALIGDSVRGVLPVTAIDILGHEERVSLARFIPSSGGVRNETRAWKESGSNAWAIAPSHSASGNALLLANPHLPWGDLFTWIETQYSMPGMDVYGGALVGSPVLQIAFNDNLGWTHTVNTQDGEDLYELTLADSGYVWNGAVSAFDRAQHVLFVKGRDGAMRAEFQAAIHPNQLSGQNITYADRDGHIMVFYGGNSPVRSVGDRAYWSGIVPGESSSNLWTSLHAYRDMPITLDPPNGWVQNANDPPWWSTFPVAVHRSDYPDYLASRTMALRPQRSARMLSADSSITFDELIAYTHSTRMEAADRLLDDLLPAARASTSAVAHEAADVLDHWDRSADNVSRGGVLFAEWWRELGRLTPAGKSLWAIPWSESRPRETPDGLSDPALAAQALEKAAARVKSLYGAIDVPWGDVYRLRRDTVDLHARSLVGYGNASRAGSPHRVDQLSYYSRKELKPVWRRRAEIEAHLEKRESF